jgi:nucleoside-diphosphate-sugar epimerase
MRVFVTGATGYIGTAIVHELMEAGHKVVGLARSDESAETLRSWGAEVHHGSLQDLDSLRKASAGADGVIHTAFNNMGLQTDFADACQADRHAIEAIAETLADSDRPFVITSGTALLKPGFVGTEEDAFDPDLPHAALRGASEEVALSYAERGVRVSVIRLPLSVHSGEADKHGFIPSIIGFSREKGSSAYVGDGSNHWPAVHQLDAAHLYRLALESAPAGSRLHAIGDQGIPFRNIAEVIGRKMNLPVASVNSDEAADHFSWLAAFVALDSQASSAHTQELLDWKPTHSGLLEDLEQDFYFDS